MDEYFVNAANNGWFKDPSIRELSRADFLNDSYRKFYTSILNPDLRTVTDNESLVAELYTIDNVFMPGSVGWMMTSTFIKVLGSPEQVSKWAPAIDNNTIICAYA